MTRLVFTRGHHMFFDHGDGLGGASARIPGILNTSGTQGGEYHRAAHATIWKSPSGDGTTNVDGTFAVGDTVMTQFYDGGVNKVHEMTYRGTYSYTDSNTGVTHEFLVLHSTTSYGGSFLLVGPHVALKATRDAILADFNSENDITAESYTVCFFPGTLIATPTGERRVEELVSGDQVLVEDAGSVPATWIDRMARKFFRSLGLRRAVHVKWIGRQTVSTLFGPADRLMPVRFAAGSLGGGGNPFCRIAT